VDEFLGPCFACVFGRSFSVSAALHLAIDDSRGDLATKEVFPSNPSLVDRCAEQWVCRGNLLWDGGVAEEPLEEALQDQFADWLGSVAGVVEVVQGDS
jgi:hypothetical protein